MKLGDMRAETIAHTMMALPMRAALLALFFISAGWAAAQGGPTSAVREIAAPAHPLPEESASASVTKFAFIAYGDTRGRQDGIGLQHEHSRVLDSMIGTIARLEGSAFPVRFVLQSGDAVVNGRDATHWNRSFVDLVNRITTHCGAGHSCGIHTANDLRVRELALKVKVSRIMIRQPQCLANSGAWTNGMPMKLTLGCGSTI